MVHFIKVDVKSILLRYIFSASFYRQIVRVNQKKTRGVASSVYCDVKMIKGCKEKGNFNIASILNCAPYRGPCGALD